MQTPQIIEIIRRADQGATRPFICRADDGKIYYVKGKSASTGERIREWMGGNLAKAFGLNAPKMAILEIPKFLIHSAEEKSDLGAGYAVGSQQVLATSELRHEETELISRPLQQQILLFDYWVRNEDRTLSDLGGNPNLLWDTVQRTLYAIDYNLILQNDFDEKLFWATHAFANSIKLLALNASERQANQERLHKALSGWSECWQQLPEEWLLENESTAAFDEAAVLKQLQDDANGQIWRNIKS